MAAPSLFAERWLRTLMVAAVLGWAAPPAPAQMVTPLAYRVKAAFVYNFALFVEWPQATLGPEHQSVVVGIVGDDPLATELEQVDGKRIGTRTLRVTRLDTQQEFVGCHILYVGASERERLPAILERAAAHHVLTVGDMARFIDKGGMIGFIIEGESVRFEVCLARAQRAGLKLSAKLLQVARLVDCGKD